MLRLLLLYPFLFASFGLQAAPNERAARELLESFRANPQNEKTARLLASQVSETGWSDLNLLHDCLWELRHAVQEGMEVDVPNTPADLYRRIVGDRERFHELTPEQLVRSWTETAGRFMGMGSVSSNMERFLEVRSTPEQRVAMFAFLRRHLMGTVPGGSLLPSGGTMTGNQGWGHVLGVQVGYSMASPEAKIIAMARMAAAWDESPGVRAEATAFMREFNASGEWLTQWGNPELAQIGREIWRDLHLRSNGILESMRTLIQNRIASRSGPVGECQRLMATVGELSGSPRAIPAFISFSRFSQVR